MKVLVRLPLPYNLGESGRPGNVEEKLRCEAAAFVCIRDHCAQVPIPRLWGFGFADGQSVRGAEPGFGNSL